LALIKSLIYAREEEGALEARLNKIDQSWSNLSADSIASRGQLDVDIFDLGCSKEKGLETCSERVI